ncbi:MAG TPA: metallopeptidase TldD-related protein [Actinomycetota bacterium]
MSELLGPDRLAEAIEPALRTAADGTLVVAVHTAGGLTRFASSRIHQNTHREDLEIRVMAVADGSRVGVATTHSPAGDRVAAAAADALAIARVTPRNPSFPGIAEPQPLAANPPDRFDEATAVTSPAERAAAVTLALNEFPADMEGAGAVETVADEVMVATSGGVRHYGRITRAAISVMAMSPDSSGYAELIEGRLSDLDPAALGARSVRKAEAGRNPQPIDAGSYTVILEPAATSTLMQFLGWLGFGAKSLLEERSFMAGKIGATIMDERVTITDDPLAVDALGLPFDFEGTPAQPVMLIDKGVAAGVVWDRETAGRGGRTSTGHGLPAPNPDGPFPLNLRMEPGTDSLDDLIAGCERGLLVTRFHYSNIVHEKDAILTGMTRDGTFWVEDGKVRHGVRNLRYTQNAVEALSNIEAIGDTTEISSELFFGGSRAPALRIRDFKFSSTTDH